MLSVMLYIHWKLKEERFQLNTFFDLWRKVFPENPLPEGIKRKRNNNKKRKLELNNNNNPYSKNDSPNNDEKKLKEKKK